MLEIATIFQPLVTIFGGVLKFIHNDLGVSSWGWSIVLLTVFVRAIMLPLTIKQFHSMQKLQRLSPEMKRLQAKYKDDKQRQQQELMKLYQEHGVNPFASCLPLVAQLPVFIGLYYTLRTSLRGDICPQLQPGAHLNSLGHWVGFSTAHTKACGGTGGASFLFIHDLTAKAVGGTLVVLIVLYVGTQLASQLLMATPQMDKTQQRLMMLLPLVFVFIIIRLPAGVLVYWITTNLWTIGQQYVMRRRLGPMTPLTAAADGEGGKSPPGGGGGSPPGPDDGAGPNGAGAGGLGALLRGRGKAPEPEPVGAGARTRTRTTAPPPPPRKKKKRSGRRR
jgi:YidC/Oxa1 family membrane protein insertase